MFHTGFIHFKNKFKSGFYRIVYPLLNYLFILIKNHFNNKIRNLI